MNHQGQLIVAFGHVNERMRDLQRAVSDFLLRPDDVDRLSEIENANWSLLAADENLRRAIFALYAQPAPHAEAGGDGHPWESYRQHVGP
jgi:hypothetical protein